MQKTLSQRDGDIDARTTGNGLMAVAQLNRKAKNKRNAREFIEGYLDHPKATFRVAAIRALGELRDPQTEGLLESFSADRDGRMAKAATEALKTLRDEKPFVPAEIAELRRVIGELKQEQDELRSELKQLRLRRAATDPSEEEHSAGQDEESQLTEGESDSKPNKRKKARKADDKVAAADDA